MVTAIGEGDQPISSAHIFNDEATLLRVAQAIIETGPYTGFARGYDRYGLLFTEVFTEVRSARR